MQMRSQEASFRVITAVVGGRDLSTRTLTHAHAGHVHKLVPTAGTGGSKGGGRARSWLEDGKRRRRLGIAAANAPPFAT